MADDERRVLIAGAGPCGLLCAWLLGREGLPVRLFDKGHAPQPDLRAATVQPATLDLLRLDGLADDMARVGLTVPAFQFWDRVSGALIATFDYAVLRGDTAHPFVVQCEQEKTQRLILERLRRCPSVEVLFGHEVVDVKQNDMSVRVEVRGPDGTHTHAGAYLIGADGARSTVRERCDIPFEGFTWPERFLVLATPYDFAHKRGYAPRHFFAHPETWSYCFKVAADGPPGLWRVVFPVEAEQDAEELMSGAALQARLQRLFPAPRPYEIIGCRAYVAQQRVATTFRHGRVILAGDAAHIDNPIGAMGLNGGLQDAVNLAEKLARILLHGEPDRWLDLYNRQRRTVAIEFVQDLSIASKRLLEARDPDVRRQYFDELRATAADPERAREFLLRTSMIASQRRAAAMTLPA